MFHCILLSLRIPTGCELYSSPDPQLSGFTVSYSANKCNPQRRVNSILNGCGRNVCISELSGTSVDREPFTQVVLAYLHLSLSIPSNPSIPCGFSVLASSVSLTHSVLPCATCISNDRIEVVFGARIRKFRSI